ncbi:hypothetical protein [Pseudoalteromonas sp. S558]|uniref:hypothetical protein n=1 Tax=Pseudoalteromonas sp. S558 TaxID=2066515 RepID=UPI00110B9AD0|nr:hypothetical protein [Pseudoalteromonas sp. S558]TMO05490.1 hypothetical protein CWB66_06645 [Pseudoalteromonas sp. S558]
MAQNNKRQSLVNCSFDVTHQFTAQSGLTVKAQDNLWVLSATGKGRFVDVTWLHEFEGCEITKNILLDTLIHYAETKTAGTVSTQKNAVFSAFPHAFRSLQEFRSNWQQLGNSAKKTLKGFMSTCVLKLNHKHLMKHYEIANTYQHKPKFNALHPTKGRLTDFEYDSILDNLRALSAQLPISPPQILSFYQSQGVNGRPTFSYYKKILSYRLMVQIARRPKQISILKWCDVLPVGISFGDAKVNHEPTFTGVKLLHLRSFKIKQSNNENCFRATPEKWTIPISESFSSILMKYREIYKKGISLALQNYGEKNSDAVASKLINYCPIFPQRKLFNSDLSNYELVQALMSKNSILFHLSENDITGYQSIINNGLSERHGSVKGNNNRLRHTWLCNAALEGKPIQDISKITNVTIPAARSYLQLGLKERQFIDEKYAANSLLRKAFNPIPMVSSEDILILSQTNGPIGIEKDKFTCQTCEHKSRMVRPIPCYGCANFRPILEADHESILKEALAKQKFLENFGSNEKKSGAYNRLTKAIAYIKLTIAICNESILKMSALPK